MINIVENISQEIKKAVSLAFDKAAANGELPRTELPEITIEVPREKEHGDFSTNIVMQVTKQLKK